MSEGSRETSSEGVLGCQGSSKHELFLAFSFQKVWQIRHAPTSLYLDV